MDKLNKLIKSLDKILKENDDSLKENLEDFEGAEDLVTAINLYEKKIAKLLRKQKKHYTKGIEEYISKEVTIKDLIKYVMGDLADSDSFIKDMEKLTSSFLENTMSDLCSIIMQNIDKDVVFEVFSDKTTEWIKSWSADLAELMKLNTNKAIENVLNKALEDGEGIPKIVDKIMELPEFDRTRAKTTAVTETLAAHSRSQWESYMQSPAVVEKTWKHSGGKGIKPRTDHISLDGVSVKVDEDFDVGGEAAQHPRDSSLSAKQRINCHCVLGPVVDEKIIKLSKEEKLKLREEALKELEG